MAAEIKIPDQPIVEKKWRCTVCGYIADGPEPPETCPLCGVPADMFDEVEEEVEEAPMVKKWRCTVCGYVYEGDEAPDICPICGVPHDLFALVEEEPQNMASLSPEEKNRLQTLLFNVSYGLYIITAREGDFINGMVGNTFIQVTDSPLQALVCLNKGGKTSMMINETKAFTANILAEDNFDLIPKFGSISGHVQQKFDGIEYTESEVNGCPQLTNTLASIDVEVDKIVELSTHRICIGRVVGGVKHKEGTPMTYAYYHAHKPKK